MEIVKKYQKTRLQVVPSKSWNIMRLVMLWAVLPFKVIYNMILTAYAIFQNRKTVEKVLPANPKVILIDREIKSLPTWFTPSFSTYITKLDDKEADGKNHKIEDHTEQNALYMFTLGQLAEGKSILNQETVSKGFMLAMHTTGHLSNGFKYDTHGLFFHDVKSTPAETLSAVTLAANSSSIPSVLDKYDQMIQQVIDNDFALLEYEEPEDAVAKEAWLEKTPGKRKLKSVNAMFQPDPSLTGTKALILLAALKVAGKTIGVDKAGNPEARGAYIDLLWKKGYALLSAFPTAGKVDSAAMAALYVLAKNSTGKELAVWKLAMKNQQALAKNSELDAVFTGLLFDAFPDLMKSDANKRHVLYLNRLVDRTEVSCLGDMMSYVMVKKVLNILLEQEESKVKTEVPA